MTRVWLAVVPLLALTADIAAASSFRRLANASSPALYLPNCFVETGFDYLGNDIKNVPSKAAEGCCDECIKVDGCKAWSWSDYNGGTCWLKSGRGRIIVNANIKSSLLFEGNYPTCQVSGDVDFAGNDIGQSPSANAEACCDKCHSFLGCRAYSWSDYNGGMCWLKSSKGQPIVKKGVKSAEAYPVPNYYPVCAQEVDVDFVGSDIGNAPSASPDGCCAICSGIRTCSAYSWTNQNGGTCWLKNRKGGTIKKAGVISSHVRPSPAYTCDTETGIDYQGNDIANVPSIDPDFCCTICYESTDCKAYTWSDYNGGTCWLKSAKGSAVRTGKTKSGVPQKQ